MVDDVLSQDEIENLLHAMEPAPAKTGGAAETSAGNSRLRDKITLYDFKRPERVGKEQMRALQSLHEGFSRNFGAALSALLRNIVEIKLTSVDQLTYSEFVFSLENPTCFNLLRAEPLEGHLILDINPSILYPIIDRLLGGGKETGPHTRRPLTEIELRLVSRITRLFLHELRHAWETVLPLELSVERVESNPQLVQIVPPNEVVVLITFELTLGELRGMLNLCIPFNSIERISGKLSANTWIGYGKGGASPALVEQIGRRLQAARAEMVVTLAETKISTGDLFHLQVGDIITTDHDIRRPLTVAVEGVVKYLAHPGAYKNRKAIQIESVVAPEPPTPSPAKPEHGKTEHGKHEQGKSDGSRPEHHRADHAKSKAEGKS